jgi:hypothetical protein
MGTHRRVAGALACTAVAFAFFSVVAPAGAGSLEACAQRVIRDWYSGGRVDKVYPLRCYRAAIRALPSDVLQYSDADQDIRRALAFARRGRSDPGDGPGAAETPETTETPEHTQPPPAEPAANDFAITPRKARLVPDPPTATASVPYPVIALAGLAGVLLATGAAGWLASRRGKGTADR